MTEAVRSWLERLGVVDSDGNCTSPLSLNVTVHRPIPNASSLDVLDPPDDAPQGDSPNALDFVLRIQGPTVHGAAVKLLPLTGGQIRFSLPIDRRTGPRMVSLPNDFFLKNITSGRSTLEDPEHWRVTVTDRGPNQPFSFAVLAFKPVLTLVSLDIIPSNEFSMPDDHAALDDLLNNVLGESFTAELEALGKSEGSWPSSRGSQPRERSVFALGDADPVDPMPQGDPLSDLFLGQLNFMPEEPSEDEKREHENLSDVIQQCFDAIENDDYLYIRKILRTTPSSQLQEILKAKSNQQESKGQTLLHYACWKTPSRRCCIVISLLLQKMKQNGIDGINAQDDDLNTPLHLAIQLDESNTASLLLTAGADIEAKDKNNLTPLHWALHWASTDPNWTKIPAALDTLLSQARRLHISSGKNSDDFGGYILNMLKSEEFQQAEEFEGWRTNLRSNGAEGIRELLQEYGVDINALLGDPPKRSDSRRKSSSSSSSSSSEEEENKRAKSDTTSPEEEEADAGNRRDSFPSTAEEEEEDIAETSPKEEDIVSSDSEKDEGPGANGEEEEDVRQKKQPLSVEDESGEGPNSGFGGNDETDPAASAELASDEEQPGGSASDPKGKPAPAVPPKSQSFWTWVMPWIWTWIWTWFHQKG
ncbi:MAG: ankyrin repeat domain-containing protein [Puniceicoccales bacterium]|nr:ankyrin repeat domain-containing protein [Puniceicoccales bacterium]